MNHWKDIHDLSEKIFNRLFFREEYPSGMPGENPVIERLSKKLEQEGYLSERRTRQEKYDPRLAYRGFQRRVRRRRAFYFGGAAATVLLVLGFLFFRNLPVGLSPEVVAQRAILPGERKAVLTSADGTVWDIHKQDMSMQVDGALIRVDSLGLVVADRKISEEKELKYSTLSVPRGGEFFITLPDGTKVWLNSETELRFPVSFPATCRRIYLKGEAYFEVAEEKERPFRVSLDDGEITVYGTQFSVTAYEDSPLSSTLVEGSIGFLSTSGKSVLLEPSYRLVYDAEKDQMTVSKVDAYLYTSWKENIFTFEGQCLDEIMSTLARWYNVDIVFETERLKHLRLSGTIDRYDSIEPLLKLFEAGARVKFEIGQDRITVSAR